MKVPICQSQITNFDTACGLGKGLSTLNAAKIAAGGSGYVVGDVLTIHGGTADTKATFIVTSVDTIAGVAGVITGIRLDVEGIYTAAPTSPNSADASAAGNNPNGGAGTGVSLTFTVNADTVPSQALWAEVTAEGADVRWRDDGVAPTANVGMLLKQIAGGGSNQETEPLTFFSPLSNVKIIDTGGGNAAKLNVAFYGVRKNGSFVAM